MVFISTASSKSSEEQLSRHQINVLVTLERVGGSISLFAVLTIFLAYGTIRRVRNVQNTFIVFASVSNVGASIASIIALDGLKDDKRNPLCQAQSFLFEMFMQSDPWWSLAMAINVFLVFYFRTSPDSFRRWWWLYCLVCYGGPFTIAITLLFIRNSSRGPIYGGATIWCWVDSKWDSIRIYTYYMLIWICITGSIICYVLVGYHVFRSRNKLRSFHASKCRDVGPHEVTRIQRFPKARDGFYGTVTTEVQVVHTSAAHGPRPVVVEPEQVHVASNCQLSFEDASSTERQKSLAQYYSSVTSAPPRRRGLLLSPFRRAARAVNSAAAKFVIDDPVKRAYLRTSLLFALSVLVTWIPSSLNRIHGWLSGASPYEFHVATASVLPLQGLWNAIIFFVTSWTTVRDRLRGKSAADEDARHQRRIDDAFATVDRSMRRDDTAAASDTEFDDDADSTAPPSHLELGRLSHPPSSLSTS